MSTSSTNTPREILPFEPRDGDPRAAYGVVDTETRVLTVMRVEYDVAITQAKILAAGLPEVLAHRLAIGR